jgi:hypothetical protein
MDEHRSSWNNSGKLKVDTMRENKNDSFEVEDRLSDRDNRRVNALIHTLANYYPTL